MTTDKIREGDMRTCAFMAEGDHGEIFVLLHPRKICAWYLESCVKYTNTQLEKDLGIRRSICTNVTLHVDSTCELVNVGDKILVLLVDDYSAVVLRSFCKVTDVLYCTKYGRVLVDIINMVVDEPVGGVYADWLATLPKSLVEEELYAV